MSGAGNYQSRTYPKSIREYFHGALQRKEPREGCVHVVQDRLVSLCLVVVLTDHQVTRLILLHF